MKKIINLIIALIILSFVVSAAQQTIMSSSNDFKFDLLRYDPSPLEPGKSSDIYLQITNLKSIPTASTDISLAVDFPLTLQDGQKTLPHLEPGQTSILVYHISANKDAAEGTYIAGIQFMSGNAINSEKLNIQVTRLKNLITPTNVIFEPERLIPGKEAILKIKIKNTARSEIKDVQIKIDTSSSPFVTTGSISSAKIPMISSNEDAEAVFNIITLPTSTPGIYKVPLTITYIDEYGSAVSNTETIGAIVDAPIKYDLIISDRTVFIKNDIGKVTASISNIGPANIKYLTITLLPSDNYDLISKNNIYVGNLDPDDSGTADFNIKLKKDGDLSLLLNYKDVFNNEYSESKNIPLKMFSQSQAEDFNLIQSKSFLPTLIQIIIMVLAIVLVVEWIKNKSLSKGISATFSSVFVGVIKIFNSLKPKNLKDSFAKLKSRAKQDD